MRFITEKNKIKQKRILSKRWIITPVFYWFIFIVCIFFASNVFADTINLDELPTMVAEGAPEGISSVEDVSVRQFFKNISVSWKKTPLRETEAIVLVRSEQRCPLLPKDGIELYRGNGDSYSDSATFAGMSYCYGLFVTDSSGRTSRVVTTGLVEKDGAVSYLFSRIDGNRTIIAGIIIVIILAWIHKRTVYDLNRRKKRTVVL